MINLSSKIVRLFPGACLLLVVGCERMETVENSYPDMQTAVTAGIVEKGWIPAFLPPSATAIQELHNLDTNEVWMRFTASPTDLTSLEACRQIDSQAAILPRETSANWWPATLTSQRSGGISSTFVYFRCSNGGSIAAEQSSGDIFYWHPG